MGLAGLTLATLGLVALVLALATLGLVLLVATSLVLVHVNGHFILRREIIFTHLGECRDFTLV